jgi:hypothetical protein
LVPQEKYDIGVQLAEAKALLHKLKVQIAKSYWHKRPKPANVWMLPAACRVLSPKFPCGN